ncbi:MAG: sulfotransferase domain-containing protein [Microcoleus sp. PH2017_05_CCC_O_A]|nr:sulfotransferase domain-containing protein [Microcoleus sp. PH2017_05_CCC_O_A]
MFVNDICEQNQNLLTETDFILSSYPRSGNTWMRLLFSDIILQSQGFKTKSGGNFIPDIYKQKLDTWNRDPRTKKVPLRIIKSHEFYDTRYINTIYLFRKPADALCSFYYYLLGYPDQREELQKQGIDDFCKVKVEQWRVHVESYIEAKDKKHDKVLFISYESLKEQPEIILKKTTRDFLGLNITSSMCRIAIKNQNFEELQRIQKFEDTSQLGFWETGGYQDFFRKGKVNSSKDELTQSTIDFIEADAMAIYNLAISIEKLDFQKESNQGMAMIKEKIEDLVGLGKQGSLSLKLNGLLSNRNEGEISQMQIYHQKELDYYKLQLQQVQEQFQQLQVENKQFKTELEQQSQSQLDQTKEELQQYKKELQASHEEAQQYQNQQQKTQQILEDFTIQLQKAETLFQKYKNQLDITQTELKQSQAQLQETESVLEQSQAQSQSQLHQTQGELEQSQSQLHQTQGELAQSQSQLHQTQGELAQSPQGELAQSQSQLHQTQGELAQSQSQLHQTQGELAQYSEHLGQTEKIIEQYQSQLEQIKAELQQSQSLLYQKGWELECSRFQQHQTQDRLAKEKFKIDKVKAEFHQTQAELEQLKAKLSLTQVELVRTQFQQQYITIEPQLENAVQYKLLVWDAWYAYHNGDLKKMQQCLQESLKFTPLSRTESLLKWLESFCQFSAEKGQPFDTYALTNSQEWKRLILPQRVIASKG